MSTVGWDNTLFRLGRELVVRIPRRQLGADLVAIEHRWLGPIAARLSLPAPARMGLGRPGAGYPWAWSVCPWLPGQMAASARRLSADTMARQLATVLAALHLEGPRDAPVHPFGGGRSIAARDESVGALIAQWPVPPERALLAQAWERATSAPEWSGPDLWLHGDLHPANLLVSRGRLRAILDFGDLCAGDPAVDLISAWMLLPPSSRALLRAEVPADPATWAEGGGGHWRSAWQSSNDPRTTRSSPRSAGVAWWPSLRRSRWWGPERP